MKKLPEINLETYKTDFSGYKYSISFVGNPSLDNCLEILCDLVKIFKKKLHIFSSEKDFLQSIENIKATALLDEDELKIYSKCWIEIPEEKNDLAKIFNSSKINLNINSNYQIFEILSSGGFLLTNENENLEKYFKISKHLETYKDINDLIDKIDFYLKNLTIAQKIAYLGKREVIKKTK